MEFKSLRNIESSFRQMRLFGTVFLSLCAVATVWSAWSSYRFTEKQREKIYVLDNGKSLILVLSQNLSQNRSAEVREHVRRFHELFFTLSPEKSAIKRNMKRALLLTDKSMYHYHSNFAEKGYYNRIITEDTSRVLKADSVMYGLNAHPYHAATYATQKIIRQSNVTKCSFATICRPLNASRSNDSPNGFTVEGFTIIKNKDLQTIRRQRIMKQKVKSIRKTMWGVYQKLHDKRKQLVTRLKGYLDGLPPKTRRRTALGTLAVFTILTLCTFGRAICDIGRNDGLHVETGHAGRVEPPALAGTDNHLTFYLYGTDEE